MNNIFYDFTKRVEESLLTKFPETFSGCSSKISLIDDMMCKGKVLVEIEAFPKDENSDGSVFVDKVTLFYGVFVFDDLNKRFYLNHAATVLGASSADVTNLGMVQSDVNEVANILDKHFNNETTKIVFNSISLPQE